jgi:hypothetical protein
MQNKTTFKLKLTTNPINIEFRLSLFIEVALSES